VVPLFLSTKTQEAFGIHADIEVTAENPMKIIGKEQVLQDLYTRAAISDFHPVKPMMVVRLTTSTLFCSVMCLVILACQIMTAVSSV